MKLRFLFKNKGLLFGHYEPKFFYVTIQSHYVHNWNAYVSKHMQLEHGFECLNYIYFLKHYMFECTKN